MFKNYYETLEVSRNASIEVIEKAYIVLAKKYHPDSNNFGSDYANEIMKEINEAYDVLKNNNKRNAYNRKYDEATNFKNWREEVKVHNNPKAENTEHKSNNKVESDSLAPELKVGIFIVISIVLFFIAILSEHYN